MHWEPGGFIHYVGQNKRPFRSDCIYLEDLMREWGYLLPLDSVISLSFPQPGRLAGAL